MKSWLRTPRGVCRSPAGEAWGRTHGAATDRAITAPRALAEACAGLMRCNYCFISLNKHLDKRYTKKKKGGQNVAGMGWNYSSGACKAAAEHLPKASRDRGITCLDHPFPKPWVWFFQARVKQTWGMQKFPDNPGSILGRGLPGPEEGRAGSLLPVAPPGHLEPRPLLCCSGSLFPARQQDHECVSPSGRHVANSAKNNSQSAGGTNMKR